MYTRAVGCCAGGAMLSVRGVDAILHPGMAPFLLCVLLGADHQLGYLAAALRRDARRG